MQTKLVMELDERLSEPLIVAMRLLEPEECTRHVLDLIKALSNEQMNHGVYRLKDLACFVDIYQVPEFSPSSWPPLNQSLCKASSGTR
jgi:hypothetical protein